MSDRDARQAMGAGMLAGYELGYDAAVSLLEAMELQGDGEPGWSTELRKMRAKKLEVARHNIDEMTKVAR